MVDMFEQREGLWRVLLSAGQALPLVKQGSEASIMPRNGLPTLRAMNKMSANEIHSQTTFALARSP